MNNHPEENLPLDENMVNHATWAMEALVGPLLAEQVDNPYLDAGQYTNALCKAYAEQVLNAAFHGLGCTEWKTKDQVREERKPDPRLRKIHCGTSRWWLHLEDVPRVYWKNIRDRYGHALTRYPHGWVYLEGPQARKYFADGSEPINGPFTEMV